jgi:hypothetical protein
MRKKRFKEIQNNNSPALELVLDALVMDYQKETLDFQRGINAIHQHNEKRIE